MGGIGTISIDLDPQLVHSHPVYARQRILRREGLQRQLSMYEIAHRARLTIADT